MSLASVMGCMVEVGTLVSVSMCGTSASTATRATRVPLPWCWAPRSPLAPLGALAGLTWCVITVGKRGTTSAIAGSCTGSRQALTRHLPSQLPKRLSQKTEFRQLQDDRTECVSTKENVFTVIVGQYLEDTILVFAGQWRQL